MLNILFYWSTVDDMHCWRYWVSTACMEGYCVNSTLVSLCIYIASKQSPASQQASKLISSYASVCSHVVNNSSHQSLNLKNDQELFNDAECKFNVIIYGLPECKKGTPKYKRTISESNSASLAIQSICPEISQQSVRDCSRLGKYSQDHQRPRPTGVSQANTHM